jgi:flavin-dependent dehydrogenase
MKTPPSPTAEYDVIVAGGGPGGAALATFLSRSGRRCLVLDQGKFPRYHIGESLIPHTYGIFQRLGLLEKLKGSEFPLKHSVRFVARDGKESAPFYFSETIPGPGAVTWQVERGEFDRLMLDHARENGVEVRDRTLADSVIFENGRATGVIAVQENGEKSTLTGKVVVDASGRSCLIGNQLKLKTDVPGLRKASLWGYFRGGQRLPGIDGGETTIFIVSDGGWFWYIPLPDDVISVGIVAAPERLFARGISGEDTLAAEIAKCPPLAARLAQAQRVGHVRGLPQLAYLNRQTCGDGWVMIGDARAFLDPIYSSGLYLALASAELAAGCIDEALQAGDVSKARLGKFEPNLWGGVDVIRRLIHAFYDPNFSFPGFAAKFPEHRAALIDCLVGNVVKDMTPFTEALATMTPPPPPLTAAAA